MKIKEFNGMNVLVDKKLELMFAIHAVYLKNHPEARDKLDFIETPPVKYLDELEQLINSKEHQELINAILEFKDESTCVEIALSLDENYNFDSTIAHLDYIEPYLGNVNLEKFVEQFKTFAYEIKWDSFFENHKSFYQELFSSFCDFPRDLNLNDIKNFYGKMSQSYNYIPSILINGGFSHSDKLGNLYYIRGILWHEEKNKFYYDKDYLLECLFHEFSHPNVNYLVDANISLFTNLDKLFEDALKHNLPKTYSSQKSTLLYEYFVRANAFILTTKYYPEMLIDDWILEHGFSYLGEITEFTIQNMSKYKNYEEFFIQEMISFMNNILNRDKIL